MDNPSSSLSLFAGLYGSRSCARPPFFSGMAPEHWVLAAMSNSSLDMSILKMRQPSCLETLGTTQRRCATSNKDGEPLFASASYVLSSSLNFFFSFFPLLSLLSFPFRILPSFPSFLSSSFHFPFYLPFSERRTTLSSC